MALLAVADSATIELYESYPKQTYRNRCRLLTAGGVLDLTVPVTKADGNNTLTARVLVAYAEPWHVRHWRAIESAYSAAPYFLYYRDELQRLLMQRYEHLADLNQALLDYLLRSMKVSVPISSTTDFVPIGAYEADFRFAITPKRPVSSAHFRPYSQVFATRYPFVANLSAIDLLFNLGPESKGYLMQVAAAMLGSN